MVLSDPTGSSNGQIHNDNDGKWIWDGQTWVGQDGALSIENMIEADANPVWCYPSPTNTHIFTSGFSNGFNYQLARILGIKKETKSETIFTE